MVKLAIIVDLHSAVSESYSDNSIFIRLVSVVERSGQNMKQIDDSLEII